MKKFVPWLKRFIKKFPKHWAIQRPLVPLALCLLTVLVVLDTYHPPNPPSPLTPYLGVKKSYQVIVESDASPTRQGFTLNARLIEEGVPTLPVKLHFEQGEILQNDWIQIETKLKRPTRYKNPGSFNYRRYLERTGIFLTGTVPAGGWSLLKRDNQEGLLGKLRLSIHQKISEAVQGDARDFLLALLLGERSPLSPSLWDSFRKTGTAHLLAISGQHIGMVALVSFFPIFWFLKRSSTLLLLTPARKIALLFSLIPATFYALLAGAPPSAIRAVIIAWLAFAALSSHRDFDLYSALAAAAVLILLFQPSALFHLSFQLSFLAVLSMALFSFSITGPLNRSLRWLLYTAIASAAATLGTAPLVAYHFHQFPVGGILFNLIAIPFCTLILFLALILLPLSFLHPFSLKLLEFPTRLFLDLIQRGADHSWVLSLYPNEKELIVCYSLLLLIALFWHQPRWKKPLLLVTPFLIILWIVFSRPSDRLRVTFLDVGQGDAVLIQTPDQKNILIDGGGFLIPGKPILFDVGEEVVVPFLKREGISKIDLMILSHPHPDHYGGLRAVVKNFPVREFWWNGQRFPDETFHELFSLLQGKGVKIRPVQSGVRWQSGPITLETLYPEKIDLEKNINNNCLVHRLTYDQVRFLLTGDIERRAEDLIVKQVPDLKATVLKIPHHGSRSSSSVPLIDEVSPRYAVISLGEGNMFHFPHEGVLEKYERRDIKIFRTDQNGAVTFITDGTDLKVRPYLLP